MKWIFAGVFLALWTGPLAAQCPDGSAPPCGPRSAPTRLGSAGGVPSLSVLYFRSLSADSGDAALAEGITEELIARLSQIDGLRVASRYGALRYAGRRAVDPRMVGRELGVSYVLQGTLRRGDGRVRVTVEVTDVATGYNAWGQTYDLPRRDVFVVQDSVAVSVAEAVRGRLTRQERARLVVASRTSPEAMEAYLRGRAAVRGRTGGTGVQAINEYKRAIALDPTFVSAHAALAQAYVLAMHWYWRLPDAPADSLPVLASRALSRAMALDSTSPDVMVAKGMVIRDEDPQAALPILRRAVRRDSTNIEALHQLAVGFVAAGMLDSGLVREESVVSRDPYYAYAYSSLAQVLILLRRPVEALARIAQGIAIDSTHAPLYWHAADANLLIGRPGEARAAALRAIDLGLGRAPMTALLAIADIESGDTTAARAKIGEVETELRRSLAESPAGLPRLAAGLLSTAYAQLGATDSAVVWAQRIYPGQRKFYSMHFSRHWAWDPIRSDPRFAQLVREAGAMR